MSIAPVFEKIKKGLCLSKLISDIIVEVYLQGGVVKMAFLFLCNLSYLRRVS